MNAPVLTNVLNLLSEAGLKILAALALWLVGRWLIGLVTRATRGALHAQKVETTLIFYLQASLSVALNIVLVVSILGYFGVETTSFAALLAAAGIAIGAAWGGLLANFAAGAFLVILHPFKVGDFVTIGGVTGTVLEVGLFTTVLNTPDNIRTIMGNNVVFSGTIQNYTANPYRRVELVAQLNHSVDHNQAIELLREKLPGIANVLSDPAPVVEILEFNLNGPVLCVRPFCHNNHYWQVYFDTNKVIKESFGAAGFPAPEQHFRVRTAQA